MATQSLISSTFHRIFSFGFVKSYWKMEKKQTTVPRCLLLEEYDKFICRTDLMGENINRYWIGIHGKILVAGFHVVFGFISPECMINEKKRKFHPDEVTFHDGYSKNLPNVFLKLRKE
jgi:hypothetical protein